MAVTSWQSPSTVVEADDTGASWSNITNVTASDDNRATWNIASQSNYIKCTNFSFSIPSGSTIDGIEVQVEAQSGGPSQYDNHFYLVVGDTIQTGTTNQAVVGSWPGSDTTRTYPASGGSNDTWGNSLSYTDVNASNFGFACSFAKASAGAVYVDHIQMRVYYTEATNPAPSASDSITLSESSTVEIYNYVIYDTFTGSNGADVTGRTPDTVDNGNTWFDIARTGFPGSSGGGTIQGNQLQLGNDYGGQAIDAEASDVIIKVDWTPGVSSLNRNDIVFRWSSNDDYWVFLTREDNNDALLIWYGGGSGGTTDSSSYTFNEGTTYKLMVVLSGDNISCYVDGQLLLSGNSSTHNTNTKHGLLRETSSSASRYDNFAILTAPSAGEPLKINIAGYTGVRVF